MRYPWILAIGLLFGCAPQTKAAQADEYVAEKYQFFDVYPTKDGRWATCGDPYKYDDVHRKALKPVAIEFAVEVKSESTGMQCAEGNFVEDLFQVKKEGVLKARGLFK